MKTKRFLTILLSLVLMLSLLPAAGIPAHADGGAAYADYENNVNKPVTFNGHQWYIIDDSSSSATSGTVTLLAKGTEFNLSAFDAESPYSSDYSSSTVKAKLDKCVAEDFAGVADAVVKTDNGKLYLLSKEEAQALQNNGHSDILQANFTGGDCTVGREYWLSSPGRVDDNAAFVYGEDGIVSGSGIVIIDVVYKLVA